MASKKKEEQRAFQVGDRVALVRPCGPYGAGTTALVSGLTNIGTDPAANIEIGDTGMRIYLTELRHAK